MNDADILKDWVSRYTDDLFALAMQQTSSFDVAGLMVQQTFLSIASQHEELSCKEEVYTFLVSKMNKKFHEYFCLSFHKDIPDETTDVYNYFNENGCWRYDFKDVLSKDAFTLLKDDTEFLYTIMLSLDILPVKWSMSLKIKTLTLQSADLICARVGVLPTDFVLIAHRAKLQMFRCIYRYYYTL